MSESEEEQLANKAGFSFAFGRPSDFTSLFQNHMQSLTKSQMLMIQKEAGISDRMLCYIHAGRLPSKESALAIAIALNLSVEECHAEFKLSKAFGKNCRFCRNTDDYAIFN